MIAVIPPVPLIMAFTYWIAGRILASRRPESARRRGVGTVALIGAGPGAADLITLRGLARLRVADLVLYDRLADPALLAFARPGARLVNVGKAPGHHPVPQERINALVVAAALAGRRVARLKCGDPGVFGRGAEEARACAAAGIPCEIIPGVTAACGAAAAAGGFLTERGQTDRVVLVTGHRTYGPSVDWSGMSRPGTTMVIYMGMGNLAQTAAHLIAAGWPPEAMVEVVWNAQGQGQLTKRSLLGEVSAIVRQKLPEGPATVLIRWPFHPDAKLMRPDSFKCIEGPAIGRPAALSRNDP